MTMGQTMSDSGFQVFARSDSLAQRAYEAIRESIRDERLRHGETYSEGSVGALMGVSRTPVREALIELAREGLIEILPQRGFRLRRLSVAEQLEVFELRASLECLVVERLARERSDEMVEQLRELLTLQAGEANDPTAFLKLDEAFHLMMPSLVNMERTHKLLSGLRGAMWLIGAHALQLSGRAPSVLDEHKAIVDAIADGDPRAANRAMRRHLRQTASAIDHDPSELDGVGDGAATQAMEPSS